MSVEDHMDKFLDLFEKFESCAEKRRIRERVTDRRNVISLFGIYLVTRKDEE